MTKSIYYRQPYHQTLVRKIKKDINDASVVLFSGKSSLIDKTCALGKLARLVPVIVNDMPEPTVENTNRESSHILIGIYDRFFSRIKLPSRINFLKAILKLLIIINDTDFYSPFISWWVWELRKSDWPPLGPHQPDPHFFEEEK